MINDLNTARTFSRRSLHGQVAHELGVQIVSGSIPEGDILSTEKIACADLEVSRTAYREAIKVLMAKGLVESRPKVGTRVRARSQWNMLDPDVLLWESESGWTEDFAHKLFEFREIIEPAAARLAAQRATADQMNEIEIAFCEMAGSKPGTRKNVTADLAFHAAILRASGNELLSSLSCVVQALLERSFQTSSQRPGADEVSIPLHKAVLDHIADGAGDHAAQAMAALLTSAKEDLQQVMQIEAEAGPAIQNYAAKKTRQLSRKLHPRNKTG